MAAAPATRGTQRPDMQSQQHARRSNSRKEKESMLDHSDRARAGTEGVSGGRACEGGKVCTSEDALTIARPPFPFINTPMWECRGEARAIGTQSAPIRRRHSNDRAANDRSPFRVSAAGCPITDWDKRGSLGVGARASHGTLKYDRAYLRGGKQQAGVLV